MSATPRTDEAWAKRFDYHDISPWSLCMKLEIELAEADQKWERRLIAALGGHADSKLWGDDGLIAATWRCVEGYEKMEKDLAEAKAEAEKWEKLYDQDTEYLASLQKRDNYGPTETLNEAAMRLSGELAEAREQRDGAFSLIDYAGELLGVPKQEHKSAHGFKILQAIKELAAVKGGGE